MPSLGIELEMPAIEQPQTYVLDRTSTGIDTLLPFKLDILFLLARSLVGVSFINLGPFAHSIALLPSDLAAVNLDRFVHYICLSSVVSEQRDPQI
jgi:hypothetical protein